MTPDLIFDAGMETGEGPLWDHRRGVLHCLDSTNPAVWTFDAEGRVLGRTSLPERIGFVALTPEEEVLVAGLETGLFALGLADGALERLLDPEPDMPGNRINDGVVDRDGALVFGTLDDALREPTGAAYRLSPDGRLEVFDRGYVVSNGPCPHPDGERLLFVNSEVHQVHAFRRAPDGRLVDPRPFCNWPAEWGVPDGVACDEAGGVWIAHWGGARLSRFHPDGTLDHAVPFPVAQVTKPAFGGPDLTDIYVTTANRGRRGERHAGALFRLRSPIRGVPAGILDPKRVFGAAWRGNRAAGS